jgi:hypothetical protein
MFLGDGASDCGTLTIRCAARPLALVLLNLLGVERGGGGVARRGALLGPEGSGLILVTGFGLVFLGHLLHRGIGFFLGVVVWLGPAFIKLLVVVFQGVCCFPCGMLSEWVVVRVGVPARILRTV